MFLMPFQVLGVWLRGLLALALLAAGITLLGLWYGHRTALVPVPAEQAPEAVRDAGRPEPDRPADRPAAEAAPTVRRVDWQFGFNRETAYLVGGLILLIGSLGGGWLGSSLLRGLRGKGPSVEEPHDRHDGVVQKIPRPDGSQLHVELYGDPEAPPVVLTHGWGLDNAEWCYVKRALAGRFRLIAWDLPGLGKSTRPADNDWDLEKLARDLDAVLQLAGGRPAVVVGHSIGGMIALTYCRLFPDALGGRVSGLALVHTTYTNPVRTAALAPVYTALQKPVLEPLCWLMVWLAPLVWLMNVLSYLNGSAHRSTERSSFSGHESRGQLEFMTRYYLTAWPAVIARGMLAMFRYDATAALPTVRVPTLVVAGDGDRLCTPEASRTMSEAIPGARLVTLRPARHCGHFEHYGEFAATLAEFAASQPGARHQPGPAQQRVG